MSMQKSERSSSTVDDCGCADGGMPGAQTRIVGSEEPGAKSMPGGGHGMAGEDERASGMPGGGRGMAGEGESASGMPGGGMGSDDSDSGRGTPGGDSGNSDGGSMPGGGMGDGGGEGDGKDGETPRSRSCGTMNVHRRLLESSRYESLRFGRYGRCSRTGHRNHCVHAGHAQDSEDLTSLRTADGMIAFTVVQAGVEPLAPRAAARHPGVKWCRLDWYSE
jgi:hypothetical protein